MSPTRTSTIVILILSLLILHGAYLSFSIHKMRGVWDTLQRLSTAQRDDEIEDLNYCLEHRGESGSWIQDWDYAKQAQYETFPRNIGTISSQLDWQKKRERFAQQRFLPTEDAPFRCETSWRWQDDHCNVTLITLEGLCRLMMEMQISRIQVIGDSMSSTFSSSFLSLIGNGNLTVDFWDKELSVVCPEGVPNLKFLHTRRNKIDTVHDLPSGFVTSNINRTAIILNFGAHMKTLEEFQGNVSTAFQWLDSLNRTNNYVVFRDLSPGHANCSRTFPPTRWKTSLPPLKEIPFHNYSEWLQSGVSDVINWMSFDSFNAHVKQMLASRMTQQPDKQKVIYLNIFNSTLLRRDGHVWRNDCLHYAIPGPVDWWVHFWYSASMEVLQIARKTQGSNVHL